MMYDTYIFDLDGTLLDTLGDLAASVNYALRRHGMPEHSLDDVRRFVGNGVCKLMERAVPDGTANPLFEEAFATFREYYLYHSLDTTHPYEGIPETLAALRERGCRLAVVSNKMRKATEELCRHFFPDTIEVAIGEDEAAGTPGFSLGSPRIHTASTVYVGASDVDIETAHNAVIPCVSVLWGFRDKDFLIQHGAKTFISAPQELLDNHR